MVPVEFDDPSEFTNASKEFERLARIQAEDLKEEVYSDDSVPQKVQLFTKTPPKQLVVSLGIHPRENFLLTVEPRIT